VLWTKPDIEALLRTLALHVSPRDEEQWAQRSGSMGHTVREGDVS
jgi:hypothetical protein